MWRSCVHMIVEEETNVQIPVLPGPFPVSLCDHLLPLHTFIPQERIFFPETMINTYELSTGSRIDRSRQDTNERTSLETGSM